MSQVFIVVNLQFEATHNWPGCNLSAVKYLKHEHRHIFYIEMTKRVKSGDREIEIITFKRQVEKHLRRVSDVKGFGSMSCEDIAGYLLGKFKCHSVKVLEDGENGAIVIETP